MAKKKTKDIPSLVRRLYRVEQKIAALDKEKKELRALLEGSMQVGDKVVVKVNGTTKTLGRVQSVTYKFTDPEALHHEIGTAKFVRSVTVSVSKLRKVMGQEWIEENADEEVIKDTVQWLKG